MAYDDSDWDIALGEQGSASFLLSRFLEYTDAELEKQLKPVSADKLSFLEKLPCLFMSEMHVEEEGQNREYVNLRIGKVSNLTVENGVIRYSFVLDRVFGKFVIEDRKVIESALSMGRWELTRTHWAVKNGDLSECLKQLGIDLDVDGQAAELAVLPPENRPVELVESLEEFLRIVLAANSPADEEVFYRGHSDKEYKLEPSLFRKSESGDYRYLLNEDNIVRELLTAQPNEFGADKYMIDKLVRMQHYGLPTRLLDVTSNPLVALYFCCSSPKYDDDGNETDGEVIVLSTKKSDVKFYDSDTVSCIANLALLSDEHKARMNTNLGVTELNATTECERLLHSIRDEKPYFQSKIVSKDLERIVFVRGRNSNSRISSQSGAFLLFGRDAILPETGHSSLKIRRLTIRRKKHILAQLEKLNIKSSTIYPGIEKTASEIAKKYESLG